MGGYLKTHNQTQEFQLTTHLFKVAVVSHDLCDNISLLVVSCQYFKSSYKSLDSCSPPIVDVSCLEWQQDGDLDVIGHAELESTNQTGTQQ